MDLDKNDMPEIGSLADEMVQEEIGALTEKASSVARTVATVVDKLRDAKLAGSAGPVTLDRLYSLVQEHEGEINDIVRRLSKVASKPSLSGISPMGPPGLRKAAQGEPFGGAALALAPAAAGTFTLTNNKGYSVSLADLQVQAYDPATGLGVPVELSAFTINGDNYGNGAAVPSTVFDQQATQRPVINRIVQPGGTLTFLATNNNGIAVRVTAAGTCYPLSK